MVLEGFGGFWGKMAASWAVEIVIPGVFDHLGAVGINTQNMSPGKAYTHQPRPTKTKIMPGLLVDSACFCWLPEWF